MNNFKIIIIVHGLKILSILIVLYFAYVWSSSDNSGEAGYAIFSGPILAVLWYLDKRLKKNNLEEAPSSSIKIISKSYDNYDIELQGEVKVSNNFKPFRIIIENEDPDDPSEWAFDETLNIKKPFYTLKTKIHANTINKTSHVIYNRCTDDEDCKKIHGYIYRIEITNITDNSEDIVFRNKVTSSIIRTGSADRILTAWDMGGAGNYIKLNKDIPLKEGIESFKFKNVDYITLRSRETIILAIAYRAKEQGVYLPKLSFDISYANAKGTLTIKLPELIVPKLFGWVPVLSNFEYLTDIHEITERNDYLGITWYLFDEEIQKVKDFSFSRRKLSKDDLRFMGKDYCRIFRNKLFALKGAKYKPKISVDKVKLNQFTSIENYNIKIALEVEEELIKK